MRKPWQTSEWRKKRRIFIKDKFCLWCGSKENLAIHHPFKMAEKTGAIGYTEEDYNSFKGAIVLCRRCHFATHRWLVLCKICKKKYHKKQYDCCFDCLPSKRKKEIKSWEEEVPLIKVIPPCGSETTVYSDHLEFGGMLGVCLHQCPNPKISGDVNNCEFYKKYDKQLMAQEISN